MGEGEAKERECDFFSLSLPLTLTGPYKGPIFSLIFSLLVALFSTVATAIRLRSLLHHVKDRQIRPSSSNFQTIETQFTSLSLSLSIIGPYRALYRAL